MSVRKFSLASFDFSVCNNQHNINCFDRDCVIIKHRTFVKCTSEVKSLVNLDIVPLTNKSYNSRHRF